MSELEQIGTLLAELSIPVDAGQLEILDRYRQLLWDWNGRMNLTRHTTLEKFVHRDVVDSWQLCQLLEPDQRVLDMGTGGGVPGIVMAILRSDLTVELSESTQKKATAVQSIVEDLGFTLTVNACRAEDVLEVRTFDTIVARAVAPLPKILRWVEPHWGAFDELLLIKGRNWAEERGEARHLGLMTGINLRIAAEYLTPQTDAQSVILKLWREGSTV